MLQISNLLVHAVNMLQYKFSLQLFSKDVIKMNSVLCEGILVL